ncbi:hypothetical protein BDV23DRAFT_175277 [Aspergillus alliaceus]|uniref:DUF7702 domain-containing protein n=1 Tax=Petromyces alliaceus TaxID=209559 RepID=A0A5N7BYX6_PETAA|nr:hypothetical protein BDV23DRAFT_175277 [Aspergillus alliaceus]
MLFRHGRTGLLEWFFLLAFCTLRIVGGSMAIGSGSLAAEIISSVGISPLLLTVDGFLYEAYVFHWLFMAVMHILAVTGVAIVAAGAGGLASRDPSLNDLSLLQTGMALLTAAWMILLTWALCALLQGQYRELRLAHTFIRIRKAQLNPVTGSLVIRVLLSSLPELIATLIFILVGFQTLTFNIHRQGLQ